MLAVSQKYWSPEFPVSKLFRRSCALDLLLFTTGGWWYFILKFVPPLLDPLNSNNITLGVIYLFYQVNINLNDRFSFYTLPIYLHRHVGKYSCLVNASHTHSLHLYVDDSYHPSTYPKKLAENVSVIEGKAKDIYRTCSIISHSQFEAALIYKPQILRKVSCNTSRSAA